MTCGELHGQTILPPPAAVDVDAVVVGKALVAFDFDSVDGNAAEEKERILAFRGTKGGGGV